MERGKLHLNIVVPKSMRENHSPHNLQIALQHAGPAPHGLVDEGGDNWGGVIFRFHQEGGANWSSLTVPQALDINNITDVAYSDSPAIISCMIKEDRSDAFFVIQDLIERLQARGVEVDIYVGTFEAKRGSGSAA